MNQQSKLVAADLRRATAATNHLATAGVAVLGAMFNGRRALLIVDRMPAGVGWSIKRRSPNHLGGYTEVHAAEFLGCQIESLQDVPARHQAQRPTLQVVANG